MPQPVDPNAVAQYAAAFGKQEQLRSCGFSFLCDVTGKLFRKNRVALKDINGNTQAGSVRTKEEMILFHILPPLYIYIYIYKHIYTQIGLLRSVT